MRTPGLRSSHSCLVCTVRRWIFGNTSVGNLFPLWHSKDESYRSYWSLGLGSCCGFRGSLPGTLQTSRLCFRDFLIPSRWRSCWLLFTFTFMHLADAFIQSDLQCIQAIIFFLSVCITSLNRVGHLQGLSVASSCLKFALVSVKAFLHPRLGYAHKVPSNTTRSMIL